MMAFKKSKNLHVVRIKESLGFSREVRSDELRFGFGSYIRGRLKNAGRARISCSRLTLVLDLAVLGPSFP